MTRRILKQDCKMQPGLADLEKITKQASHKSMISTFFPNFPFRIYYFFFIAECSLFIFMPLSI